MLLREFERVLAIATQLGVGSVDLLGGEPTLHPEFLKMLEAVKREGLRASFSTNGANVEILHRASESFSRDFVQPGVSVNDEPVGDGLHDYIMTVKPAVKSVCTRQRKVPLSARPYLDVTGLAFFYLFLDMADARDLDDAVTFPSYLDALDSLKVSHQNVNGVHCGFLGSGPRCPGGTTKLTVLPDGSVFPCYLLAHHAAFRLGNIRDDPFSRIWKNPVLRVLRHSSENPCGKRDCRIHDSCKGGCPAMSLLVTGSLDGPDPRCGWDNGAARPQGA